MSKSDARNGAGTQLDSQTLYERQKRFREAGNIPTGPAIVAAGLRVPENLGMVLRLADAAGAARVVFVNDDTPIQTRIRKTARNADTFVSWEICDAATFLQKYAPALQPLIAVEITTRSTSLFETELPRQCALVVGSEQHGIPAEILRVCERAVHIPLFGVNGSLNVTHALAVVVFEWWRQHVQTKKDLGVSPTKTCGAARAGESQSQSAAASRCAD